MKIFLHVFYTWLLTQLFHPFIFSAAVIIRSERQYIDSFLIDFIFSVSILGLIFSIPGLLVAWSIFYLISNLNMNVAEKFVLWVLGIQLVILSSYLPVSVIFFNDAFELQTWFYIIPFQASALLSVIIRYYLFSKIIIQKQNTLSNENNLV